MVIDVRIIVISSVLIMLTSPVQSILAQRNGKVSSQLYTQKEDLKKFIESTKSPDMSSVRPLSDQEIIKYLSLDTPTLLHH
jgi:hypothetical protein